MLRKLKNSRLHVCLFLCTGQPRPHCNSSGFENITTLLSQRAVSRVMDKLGFLFHVTILRRDLKQVEGCSRVGTLTKSRNEREELGRKTQGESLWNDFSQICKRPFVHSTNIYWASTMGQELRRSHKGSTSAPSFQSQGDKLVRWWARSVGRLWASAAHTHWLARLQSTKVRPETKEQALSRGKHERVPNRGQKTIKRRTKRSACLGVEV